VAVSPQVWAGGVLSGCSCFDAVDLVAVVTAGPPSVRRASEQSRRLSGWAVWPLWLLVVCVASVCGGVSGVLDDRPIWQLCLLLVEVSFVQYGTLLDNFDGIPVAKHAGPIIL
jgi:hypothetical protein